MFHFCGSIYVLATNSNTNLSRVDYLCAIVTTGEVGHYICMCQLCCQATAPAHYKPSEEQLSNKLTTNPSLMVLLALQLFGTKEGAKKKKESAILTIKNVLTYLHWVSPWRVSDLLLVTITLSLVPRPPPQLSMLHVGNIKKAGCGLGARLDHTMCSIFVYIGLHNTVAVKNKKAMLSARST